MSQKYVLVIGDGYNYYHPFRNFGQFSRDQNLFDSPENISLVVFTGGADINPSLYNHKRSSATFTTDMRDIYEFVAYRKARKSKLPIAGVCRGAQFLCAMAGGSLVQHLENHVGNGHPMKTWDGRSMYVSSAHHQMQLPPEDATILAWSEFKRSALYIGEDDQLILPPPEKEIECVHYPSINAIGIQYHPEIMMDTSPGFKFAEELVKKFLKVNTCPRLLHA